MTDFNSPLKKWPGKFTLPDPDDFSGVDWNTYKDGVNKPLRESYSTIHLYGYTGLEVIAACGEWKMDVPLAEVRSWETQPDKERTKLIAWIGREFDFYMRRIMDPKE